MLKSFKAFMVLLALAMAAAAAICVYQIQRLNTHLSSSTKITQNLRDQIDQILKEKESYQSKLQKSEEEIQRLNAEVDSAKRSVQSLEELNRSLSVSEDSLKFQNERTQELEKELKEARATIEKRKLKSVELEKRYQSVKADATQSSQYAKLLEAEWLASLSKGKELQADLDKTLGELAKNNQDKGRLERDVATMHYNLAVILTDQGNFEAALKEYKKVLELRPNDSDAHYNLGVIYDREFKDAAHAIEHYKAYLKISPESKESLRVREWVQEKEYGEKMKFKF